MPRPKKQPEKLLPAAKRKGLMMAMVKMVVATLMMMMMMKGNAKAESQPARRREHVAISRILIQQFCGVERIWMPVIALEVFPASKNL